MSRIRWKLLLAMMAIVVATVGLSALFTRRGTQDQVRRLLVARSAGDFARMAAPLQEHFRRNGSWRGIESVVERVAKESRQRVVLASTRGEVIAISSDLRGSKVRVEGGHRVRVDTRDKHLLITLPPASIRDNRGKHVGSVYFLPPEKVERTVELREIAILDRRLILTFAAATLVALILTILISRRITHPIEQLTLAVNEMGRGKLNTRVPAMGRDEIAQLARSFNAMANAIARQEDLRRRLVGDVAHELRTPLTNLRCEIEAIQDGLASPDPGRLGSIHDEVLHLSRLVDDLQELAVAEGGGLQLQLERIDLAPVVAHVVDLFSSDALRRRISIDIDTGQSPILVAADAVRISQIVRNLLSNALHHTPDDGSILVSVSRQNGDAVVSVADTGSGIPEGELERIFERLYRLDESRTRQSRGAGLGLAIVRSLVEMHGGQVRAESVAGKGATFIFTIPLASS